MSVCNDPNPSFKKYDYNNDGVINHDDVDKFMELMKEDPEKYTDKDLMGLEKAGGKVTAKDLLDFQANGGKVTACDFAKLKEDGVEVTAEDMEKFKEQGGTIDDSEIKKLKDAGVDIDETEEKKLKNDDDPNVNSPGKYKTVGEMIDALLAGKKVSFEEVLKLMKSGVKITAQDLQDLRGTGKGMDMTAKDLHDFQAAGGVLTAGDLHWFAGGIKFTLQDLKDFKAGGTTFNDEDIRMFREDGIGISNTEATDLETPSTTTTKKYETVEDVFHALAHGTATLTDLINLKNPDGSPKATIEDIKNFVRAGGKFSLKDLIDYKNAGGNITMKDIEDIYEINKEYLTPTGLIELKNAGFNVTFEDLKFSKDHGIKFTADDLDHFNYLTIPQRKALLPEMVD
jgi:hypothetical protein